MLDIVDKIRKHKTIAAIAFFVSIVVGLATLTDATQTLFGLTEQERIKKAREKISDLSYKFNQDEFTRAVQNRDFYVIDLFLKAGIDPFTLNAICPIIDLNKPRILRQLEVIATELNYQDDYPDKLMYCIYEHEPDRYQDVVSVYLRRLEILTDVFSFSQEALDRAIAKSYHAEVILALVSQGADWRTLPAWELSRRLLGDAVSDPELASERKMLLKHVFNSKLSIDHLEGGKALIHTVQGLNELSLLLELGANPNIQDSQGNTALHKMSGHLDYENIALLLSYAADPNIQNKMGRTPFHFSNRHIGNYDEPDDKGYKILSLFLKSNIDAELRDDKGNTLLLHMLDQDSWGDPTLILKALASHGVNLHAINQMGDNALTLAVKEQFDDQAILWLVNQGVDSNHMNEDGGNALYYMLGGLVRKMSDPTATTIMDAMTQDQIDTTLIRLLCAYADEPKDLYKTHEDHLKHLLTEAGALINSSCPSGETPLMRAAFANRQYYVSLFIEYGANIEQTDEKGRSALDYAQESAALHNDDGVYKYLTLLSKN